MLALLVFALPTFVVAACGADESEVQSMSDAPVTKAPQLYQLCDVNDFWERDFDTLSPAEQVFHAIWELEADVNNGGFHQYYFNSSGDTAFAVVHALETIGAWKTAAIVRKAHAVFPNSAPPRDRTERCDQLEALTSAQVDALDELNLEFFKYPDDVMELMHAFVTKHADEISGARALGF